MTKKLISSKESWPSGLRRRFAKPVVEQSARRFESFTLRCNLIRSQDIKYFVITIFGYSLQIELEKFFKIGIYAEHQMKWYELFDSRRWFKHKRC